MILTYRLHGQVLHTSLASLSSAKTLPYLVMFLTSNLGGWAGDYLITQRITSTAGGRKAVNTIGMPLARCFLGLCALVSYRGPLCIGWQGPRNDEDDFTNASSGKSAECCPFH